MSRRPIITATMLVSTRDQTARELHDTREMRLKGLCNDTMLCYFAWARVGTRASNKQQTRNDYPIDFLRENMMHVDCESRMLCCCFGFCVCLSLSSAQSFYRG